MVFENYVPKNSKPIVLLDQNERTEFVAVAGVCEQRIDPVAFLFELIVDDALARPDFVKHLRHSAIKSLFRTASPRQIEKRKVGQFDGGRDSEGERLGRLNGLLESEWQLI